MTEVCPRLGVRVSADAAAVGGGDGRDVRTGHGFVGEARQAKREDARTETQRTPF